MNVSLICNGWRELFNIIFDPKEGESNIRKIDVGFELDRGYGVDFSSKYGIAVITYGQQWGKLSAFEANVSDGQFVVGKHRYTISGIGDTHQVTIFDDKIYAVDALQNRVRVFDLASGDELFYYSIPNNHPMVCKYGSDNHFNSVFVTGESVIVVAHNSTVHKNNNGLIIKFDKESKEVANFIELGRQSHGYIILPDSRYIICSSEEHSIYINNDMIGLGEGLYPRGLGYCEDYIFVGSATVSSREMRRNTQGVITILKRNGDTFGVLREISCPHIHDLRTLGSVGIATP